MHDIEKTVDSLCSTIEPKRWNHETELALKRLMQKKITLRKKVQVMREMFPQWEWDVACIASKEKRLHG